MRSSPLSVVLFLLCGVAVNAQTAPSASTGYTIHVRVIDENDHPVPQAALEIRAGAAKTGSATTDVQGDADLHVGSATSYNLIVTKQGYVRTETSLEVSASRASEEVDVVLAEAKLSQQNIDVTATSTNPVTEASAPQTTITADQAKQAPTKPATLNDTLPLIPGVVRSRDGSVAIAGYGESHSALLVNSVDVTDPATGTFGLSVPIDSVDTVSVSEMPYLAQYGRFSAGVVTAETRQGGDKWEYSLNDPLPDFRIRSSHLQGLRDASPRFNVSGPVIPHKLYFMEGTEYLINKFEVRTLPWGQNETTSSAINSFTQMDAILSPNQTVTASFHIAPHSLQYSGLDYFNPRPVTPDASFHEATGTVIDRWGLAGGVLQSTFAMTRVSTGVQPQGLAEMVLTPVGNQGNFFGQDSRLATRFQWIENWAPHLRHFHGEHNLQFGTVVGHSENEGQFQARPVLLQDAAGNPLQRIDYSGGNSYAVADTEPALYAQDHWVMNSHFALDAGMRFETQTITHAWRTAPRTGFIWTPNTSAKTVVKGGIGVFYDYVPLDLYAFNSYPLQAVTTYGPGGVPGLPVSYVNLTQSDVSKGFLFVDRERASGNFAPYSMAWNLEVERTVTSQLLVRVKYLQSLANDVVTLEPQVVQGQNAFVLGSSGSARTRQVEFTARIGSAEKRQFYFSYVRQHARGDINDASSYLGNLPLPVIKQDLIGSLPNEIPNRFLLWGTYNLPKKMMVVPHIEYRNGFPYQPTDVLQQYVASTAGPQYRFPKYLSLDLRVSKDIQVAGKHAVRFSGSVINLTNRFNPLEVHSNVADPLYGTFFGNYGRHFLLDFDFLY